jgi:hypothetical protein
MGAPEVSAVILAAVDAERIFISDEMKSTIQHFDQPMFAK